MDIRVEGRPASLATDREMLTLILGSALCRGSSFPRFDQDGNAVEEGVQPLPVPRHTEMLEDECGHVIGFFIPNHPVEKGESRGKVPIVCAGVSHWGSPVNANAPRRPDWI